MKPKATPENTLQIDPSPDLTGTGKVALVGLLSSGKLFVDVRVALSGKRCGCVEQDWQAKNERGRWTARYRRELCCDEHYPDMLKPEGFTGTGKPSSMSIPSTTKLFVDARVVFTECDCGCVKQDWQTKDERGTWKNRILRTIPCEQHRPDYDELWRDQNL